MSRLPPLTTESPLVVQGRSDYFRSMSADSSSDTESTLPPLTGLGLRTEVEENPIRPMSMHPRMSRVPPTPDESFPLPSPNPAVLERARGRQLKNADEGNGYFGARREQSPSSMDGSTTRNRMEEVTPLPPQNMAQLSPVTSNSMSQSPEKIIKKHSFDSSGLAPPRSMFPKRSSSIMSSPLEPSEWDSGGSMSNSFHSQQPRKLSGSSGMFSPGHLPRSPSISSNASELPRPSFNFSRPISRVGTPGLDTPARQTSSDSQASFILADDTANTPISMHSEGFPENLPEDPRAAAPSYIYSKFSLPRGKMLQRSSPMESETPSASFQYEMPPVAPPSNIQTIPYGGQAPPSPPTRPSSSSSRFLEDSIPRPSLERSKLSTEILNATSELSPSPSRPSTDGGRSSEDIQRGRPLTSPLHEPSRLKTAVSAVTSDSASTIKAARSQYSTATTTTMSDIPAEEHVAKAIALHEAGKLNESTYHLRFAAKQGHPTGMLLFALACRHGWGMRPNQREGVEWLRKAAECASVEIAEDEDHVKEGKAVDFLERKTRKAQFALSIYELGVSHMNGWGIEQDKALALRCFEIAGSKLQLPSLSCFN